MIFTRLRLSNFKPYGDCEVSFREGVTVIHGLNGSGKSSLLEACFFALYGSKALPGTLEEIISNGTDEAAIELWFTHEGVDYHIERQLRRRGDRVTTSKCVLDGERADGERIDRDGARTVRRFVTDLVRMDAEAFVNCAYVRQGEVNKLINATAQQRQTMIDDLLQLGMLETYRERAGQARLAVSDLLENARGRLEQLDEQIAKKEAENLHAQLNDLETNRDETEAAIEHYKTQRSRAETALSEAEDVLDTYEQHQADIAELEAKIDQLETQISETAAERDDLGEQRREAIAERDERETTLEETLAETELTAVTGEAITDRREELTERYESLGDEIADLRVEATAYENQADTLEDSAADLDTQAEEATARAETLETEADEADAAADEDETERQALETERDELLAQFENTDVDIALGGAAARCEELQTERQQLGEKLAETRTRLETAREAVDEAEDLLAAGNCPTCGQPIDDASHVTTLDEKRARVETLETECEKIKADHESVAERLATAEQLLDIEHRLGEIDDECNRLADRIEDRRESAEKKRERATAERETAAEKREQATERTAAAEEKRQDAEQLRSTIENKTAKREAVGDALSRLDDLDTVREAIANIDDRIDRLTDRREALAEQNDERREWLADKRAERDALREQFDDDRVAAARKRKANAEEHLETFDEKLAEHRDQRDELRDRIATVTNKLSELESRRDERETIAERVGRLETVYRETEELESMYGELRTELRRRNVESLERMLNETFDLIYGNDAYSRIELDNDYELTVYQKDGQPLEPEQLSGGERALFNLSLRCAIYRLLAEGIEGAAPTPPLILDEPTVFLDSGHVSRLVELVDEMRGFGVRQILIVSHDDELVGAADDLITVEKNPTTNRSTVTRAADSELALPGEIAD